MITSGRLFLSDALRDGRALYVGGHRCREGPALHVMCYVVIEMLAWLNGLRLVGLCPSCLIVCRMEDAVGACRHGVAAISCPVWRTFSV